MKSYYDLQQFLKRFGIIIYMGDRLVDLEMMEEEFKELYQGKLIDVKEFQEALIVIRQEALKEKQLKKQK
ncbi:YqgQ family protein [Falsibacillus pallidus]|uniref:YqgQ family protein n=1 Tax=Falsibacillus pallidus TaxID=493781 RepID=UPI003D965ABD